MTKSSRAEPGVDGAFAGGNILVERVEGDEYRLRQDVRDTEGHWFYWCFRVHGAAGRTLRFALPPRVVGVRGPAVSLDGGRSWRWMGAEAVKDGRFSWTFVEDADEVRFSYGMPYVQEHLERFLVEAPAVRVDSLCRSHRRGRPVERLRWGPSEGHVSARVLLTARHHACEMMANYVLEGVVQASLSDSETGAWLRENVAFAAVPFVDKDGAEEGDQGKNRRPHDHGRDYGPDGSRYAESRALRAWAAEWMRGEPACVLDLHCPGTRGRFHEMVLFPCRVRSPENWRRLRPFLERLEVCRTGPLPFSLAENEAFETWDGRPIQASQPLQSFAAWAESLPGVRFAAPLETPYANASGQEVNAQSARRLGRDLAQALRLFFGDRSMANV